MPSSKPTSANNWSNCNVQPATCNLPRGNRHRIVYKSKCLPRSRRQLKFASCHDPRGALIEFAAKKYSNSNAVGINLHSR